MARSFKSTPIIGNCSHSDKPGKALASRAYRVAVRSALRSGREIPVVREISDPWSFPKDGKRYIGGIVRK